MEPDMNKRNLFTSNSKKNILFLLKLILLAAILFGYFNLVFPEYSKGYNASFIDKVERLELIDEPKIVLLGNSNLTFGIDSTLIEEATGMKVVNMGLHSSMGNAFHEEMAKFNVSAGDIYILCHSSFFDDNTIDDAIIAWTAIENNYHLWNVLRPSDYEEMLRGFPVYLKKSLNLYASGEGNQEPKVIYARSSFNEQGDVAVLREENMYTFTKAVSAPQIGETTVNRINALNTYLEDRGATLLIAAYPIGNGGLTADAEDFIEFQEELISRLDCTVISNYVDYMLDYSYFYDTDLHLNTAGAAIRTKQLISDIRRWQETERDSTIAEDIYIDICSDVNLSHITDINEYLAALDEAKERYTIIISVKDDASFSIEERIVTGFGKLDLENIPLGQSGYSYIAVIDNGEIICDQTEHEKIEFSGYIDEDISCNVISAGYDRGSVSSILLNGIEYSKNESGLNFVIYSNESHRILDKVSFDMSDENFSAVR